MLDGDQLSARRVVIRELVLMAIGRSEYAYELVEAHLPVTVGIGRGEDGSDDVIYAILGFSAVWSGEAKARQDGAQLGWINLSVPIRVKKVEGFTECGG
mmetsp:Transcript_15106/g.46104  ORF Transcript_15106/g.46104 Transcript_15106/m.46104 type:complete len:99 (-) Transcript_15106:362-658(-)